MLMASSIFIEAQAEGKSEMTANGNNYPQLSGAFTGSFAYVTIKDRLPVILTKVVDLLFRERNQIIVIYGEDASEDTKKVIGILSCLKNEMQTNKPFILLTSSFPDTPIWNRVLDEYVAQNGTNPAWFESSFLYTECYMYRRIFEAFQLSTALQALDPFQKQKETAFLSSLEAIKMLGRYLQHTEKLMETVNKDEELIKNEFLKLLQVCLWGNRCDLSISAGQNVSLDSDPLQLLEGLQSNIISNDMHQVWNVLWAANQRKTGRVQLDVVLDNAGYELFCDMCLSEFLQNLGLVKEVHWYVKVMPWYVSDTMKKDIYWTISNLCDNDPTLSEYGWRWKKYFDEKTWAIEEEIFWTLPHDYSKMKAVDPKLYSKLQNSDLILFKGDLNYRKLIADKQWPFTTPFRTAVRGFEPASFCALRTVKCDCLAGIAEDQAHNLNTEDISWMLGGEFAVIQCLTPSC